MTELQVAPGVKMISGADVGLPANSEELQRVFMWDLGPEKPKSPARPHPPKGKDGDPEFDLAKVEFKEALEDYEAALKAWKQQKQEYADWQENQGGPVERMFWSCDASTALQYDAEAVKSGRQLKRRYYVSSRTRGHSGLQNRGLPDGMKPGHGQAEQERREREGENMLLDARRSDPFFGEQEIRT